MNRWVRRSRAPMAATIATLLVATPVTAEYGFDVLGHRADSPRPAVLNLAERGMRLQSTVPLGPPAICYERHVFVIGDSLTVGAIKFADLDAVLAAGDYVARIDARQSRFSDGGADQLQIEADAGTLEPVVVVALGTNDATARFTTAWFAEHIDATMAAVGPWRTVLWMNLQLGDTSLSDRFNAVLAFKSAQYPNLFVLDWASTPSHDELAGDGIHLGPRGYVQRVAFLKDQLDRFTCRRLSS